MKATASFQRVIQVLLLAAVLSIGQTPARVPLVYPNGLALDAQGSLYVSDIGTHQVLKLTRDGRFSVVAGTGEPGFSGDGGPATKAELFGPHDLAIDPQGNLLIVDSLNHRVRRIDGRGIISTVAGTGAAGYAGDGGPAANAQLNGPQGITFDRAGNILVADTYNHVIRRIDGSGVITTFAGKEPGLSGDGGPATAARISLPTSVAVAPDGTVYIADSGNSRIRRVTPDGAIQTIAGFGPGSGLGGAGFAGDSGPAAKAKLFSPAALQIDTSGNMYISDSGNNRIRVIRDGVMSTVVGSDEGPLNTPQKISLAPDGRLFIADRGNGCVRVVDSSGKMNTVAGEGQGKGITLSFTGKP